MMMMMSEDDDDEAADDKLMILVILIISHWQMPLYSYISIGRSLLSLTDSTVSCGHLVDYFKPFGGF